jgi:anti-sigma-K factor RskA
MEHIAHLTELIPAYVLGILDPEEQARVEDHLETCADCRAEEAVFRDVTGHLALAVPETPPPAGLRRQVLENAPRPPEGTWWPHFRLALSRFLSPPVWQPAAVVLVLLLVISNLVFWQRLRRLESTPPTIQQVIFLGGTDAAPQATGVILVGGEDNNGTLVVNGLAPLDAGQQYQLWLVQGEDRDTGAIFSVVDSGENTIPIVAPQALPAYSRFGITIEPAGGSPGPTGAGVLRSIPVETNGG